jgi:acyl-CoA synthetase (AMP-forming)/AMP-acid ligase II
LLLSTEKPAFLPGRLRFLRSASAPLPTVRHIAFEERFDLPLVETYGLSEAASQVTANPVPPAVRKVGSVGLPTGVQLRICVPDNPELTGRESADSTLRNVAAGEEGEICVRGPSVISRYTGRRGASSFKDGWFRTGDLGHQDADGYVYITGRLREVINRGGEKVSPREIEEVLLASPHVRDAAVTSEPDALYGQRIVAYVVLGEDSDDEAGASSHLRDYCLERLSAYKVPETFYVVPALPRNGNGKLARRSLETMHTPPAAILVSADTGLHEGGANNRRRGVMVHG